MHSKLKELAEKSLSIINGKSTINFKLTMLLFSFLFLQGIITLIITITQGLELWGIDNKNAWGVTISNFVFWIGLAHSGTLISAILLLFKQGWRDEINRAAEAMTLISIICAVLFLLIHTGRPWLSWLWIIPYPNQFDLWLNFKSPLFWDFIAIVAYFVVSLIFWYIGLIPDLAFYKSNVKGKIKSKIYAFFCLGWKGSHSQWASFSSIYFIIAGIVTALVISVHSVISMDFALTALAGWHSTIFPPYFVIGAIFSGLALLVILLTILRNAFNLEEFITVLHFDKLNKLIYLFSWLVFFSYFIEIFGTLFNENIFENQLIELKLKSPIFWLMVLFNCLLPHFYMVQSNRKNIRFSLIISSLILIGMWLERFIIVVYSQNTGILEEAFVRYSPSIIEISIFLGSFGLFGLMYMIFIKFFPIIPIWEVAKNVKK